MSLVQLSTHTIHNGCVSVCVCVMREREREQESEREREKLYLHFWVCVEVSCTYVMFRTGSQPRECVCLCSLICSSSSLTALCGRSCRLLTCAVRLSALNTLPLYPSPPLPSLLPILPCVSPSDTASRSTSCHSAAFH